MKKLIKSAGWSVLVSFAILAVWYGFEWIQFGELQFDRDCDNAVFLLYLIALTVAFYKKED